MGCINQCMCKCYEEYKLKNINGNNINIYSLNGYKCPAKVVSVYDGDTCTVVFYWESKFCKFKCRSLGYDSPEMKPLKTMPNREEHKIKALAAKNRFIELVMPEDEIIDIEIGKYDKYGRLLVVFRNRNYNKSVNDIMIDEEHGYEYFGGTKH